MFPLREQARSRSAFLLIAVSLGVFLGHSTTAVAQENGEDTPGTAVVPDSSGSEDEEVKFLEGFRLYGSLRGQVVSYQGAVELQGNASRIGFRLTRDFFDSGIQVFGQVELGISIMQNYNDFNLSGNQGGFGRLEPGTNEDVFYPRLGFVGFDFDEYGVLTAGKQWSTYYDVAGYTDNFWVFGGRASGAYTLKSDGGSSGTGRSDKTVSYRNRLGDFGFGIQAQLEANQLTGLGSFGGSAQYQFPSGLTVGVAGNYSDIPQEISDRILGAGDHGTAIVIGAKFERPRWFLAVNYSIQESHDARNIDSLTVAYNLTGAEAFGFYEISPRFRISGGFTYTDPDAIPPLHPDFQVLYGVLGGAFYLNTQTLIYAEWRLGDSVDQYGTEESNVFALGVRLDFGLPEMQRNDAPPLRFPESTSE